MNALAFITRKFQILLKNLQYAAELLDIVF